QAAGAAPDLQRRIPPTHPLQFQLEGLDDVGRSGEKLLVVLVAASERDVVIRVLTGSLIPIGAHLLQNLGIFHLAVVILTSYGSCISRRHLRTAGELRRRGAGWRGSGNHRG